VPKNSKIKSGSFNQDSRGRWYLNLVIDVPSMTKHTNKEEVGVDLGLKNQIALSNKKTFSRENVYRQYEDKLASAQRANKKKQVRNINAKIKNIRKDWTHKITTQIAKQFALIVVGDLSSTDILGHKEKNKNVYDASIYQIKSFLSYKAIKLGGECKLVNEAYTTRQCSACRALSGPQGEKDLNIREWDCACGASHNRDTNSAINILRLGH
jgi:IS605 OrfB family transposase